MTRGKGKFVANNYFYVLDMRGKMEKVIVFWCSENKMRNCEMIQEINHTMTVLSTSAEVSARVKIKLNHCTQRIF